MRILKKTTIATYCFLILCFSIVHASEVAKDLKALQAFDTYYTVPWANQTEALRKEVRKNRGFKGLEDEIDYTISETQRLIERLDKLEISNVDVRGVKSKLRTTFLLSKESLYLFLDFAKCQSKEERSQLAPKLKESGIALENAQKDLMNSITDVLKKYRHELNDNQ